MEVKSSILPRPERHSCCLLLWVPILPMWLLCSLVNSWVWCSSRWYYIVLCLTQTNLVSLKSFQDENDLIGHHFKIISATGPVVLPEIAPLDMWPSTDLWQGVLHFRKHHTKSCILDREDRLPSAWLFLNKENATPLCFHYFLPCFLLALTSIHL